MPRNWGLAKTKTLIEDERGSLSSARVGMWATLIFLGWYVVSHDKPDAGVLSVGGTILVGFMAWAGGPRAMQYFGPQLGGIAQGIAQSRPPFAGMDQSEDDRD